MGQVNDLWVFGEGSAETNKPRAYARAASRSADEKRTLDEDYLERVRKDASGENASGRKENDECQVRRIVGGSGGGKRRRDDRVVRGDGTHVACISS